MTMTMIMMTIVRSKARPHAADIDYFGTFEPQKNASDDHKLLPLMINIIAD